MYKKLLTWVVVLAVNGGAYASPEGMFVNLGVATAQIDLEDIIYDGETYAPESSSASGGSFSMGYNSSKRFGFEIGALMFGDITYEGSNSNYEPTRTTTIGYFDIKPMLASEYVNVFARLGTAYLSAQYDTEDNEAIENGDTDVDELNNNTFRAFYGVGIGVNITPQSEIILSVNKIQDSSAPITYGQLEYSYHFITKYTPGGFIAD
jgi:hypothetical protein